MFDVKVTNIRHCENDSRFKAKLAGDPSGEQGLIMFYGDSAFTRWAEYCDMRPIEEDIRRKDGSRAVVNHGFGTSTAEEQLYYYDQFVKPWNPRALVVQAFSNDLTAGYSGEEIMYLHARLLEYARRDLPGIRFFLCNVRPLIRPLNPGGIYHRDEYNKMARAYCQYHNDTTLVCHDDWPDLFEPGHAGDREFPRKELYIADNVHYNQKGYDVYGKIFRSVLDELL